MPFGRNFFPLRDLFDRSLLSAAISSTQVGITSVSPPDSSQSSRLSGLNLHLGALLPGSPSSAPLRDGRYFFCTFESLLSAESPTCLNDCFFPDDSSSSSAAPAFFFVIYRIWHFFCCFIPYFLVMNNIGGGPLFFNSNLESPQSHRPNETDGSSSVLHPRQGHQGFLATGPAIAEYSNIFHRRGRRPPSSSFPFFP